MGSWIASKSLRIWSPYLIGDPWVVKWPFFFQIASCACSITKAYLESVSMVTLLPFPRSKAQIRAMSSTNWAELPGGKGLTSLVSKLETTEYPTLPFSFKTKLLPSVYQISLRLVRGSSNNLSRGFVQWSKVSRQEWKGREPSGVGWRVAGLRTSQRDIVRPGFPSALLDIWGFFDQTSINGLSHSRVVSLGGW